MTNIDKIALDYISRNLKSASKKPKTRNALIRAYERAREKYLIEKKVVTSITTEATALKEKYTKHKELMDEHQSEMRAIRAELDRIDDLAAKEEAEAEKESLYEESSEEDEDLDKEDIYS